MKNFLLLVSITLFCSVSLAQKKSKENSTPTPSPNQNTSQTIDNSYLLIYERALSYGDFEAAKNAIFNILSKNPNNLAWHDTLVQLYFSAGAYVQCILSGTDYLAQNDTNVAILEMVAASQYTLKRYKEALESYEKLFKKAHSPYQAYQMAICQYMLQRFGECEASLAFIIADFASDKEAVSIGMANNKTQQVPLKAAAWNLRGVIFKDKNNFTEAKSCFEQALKLFPDFELAKGNVTIVSPADKPVSKEEVKKAPDTTKKPEPKK